MISETRCTICRSYLDLEDLFCSNCGTENPTGVDSTGLGTDVNASQTKQQASAMSFRCDQCGASMSYDASAKSLRCPFCGSAKMTSRPDARTLKPTGVVPFLILHSQVESLLRQWLSQGFWKPGDASQGSVINTVTKVFVPFWVFSATTETAWTADSSSLPMGAQGNWRPLSGTHSGQYEGVLVGASGTLTPQEVLEIAPFDITQSVAPETLDLESVIVEEFRVPRRDARMNAAALVESFEAGQSQQTIPGTVPLLLPIWIMVYQYRNKPYRILVNGQTGEVYGTAPFSYAKLTGVIAAMFIGMLIIIVIAALIASSQ